MTEDFIERRIITGLIISTEYIQRVRSTWDSRYLRSAMAKRIAGWCLDHYDKYQTAPGQEIETIYAKKARALGKEEAADIEDVLAGLSDDYVRGKFNASYLYDQTVEYFDESNLTDFVQTLSDLIETDEVAKAKQTALEFKGLPQQGDKDLDMATPEALDAVERAFTIAREPVMRYPRQLGMMMNNQLVRGGFVAFMGPEKRGKTFWLLDMAMRATRQGANVAFFQAGDMTEAQQLRRVAIYLSRKSDMEKYTGTMYEPVRDCWRNQLDDCELRQRECDFGVFEDKTQNWIRNQVTREDLIEAYKENPEYRPCNNCQKYWREQLGAPWLKEVTVKNALEAPEARQVVEKFFSHKKRRFKLSTHPNRTLTTTEMDAVIDNWEREEGFVPDLIIVDYADIMAPEIRADFRHQENDKWMRLRAMSQRRHCLLVTVTQTDADSYDKYLLSLKNYSEDKRKFAHVTAMYGLNQDKDDREKEIGILRINEVVVREDDFSKQRQAHVLQNLRRGQPCLSSYW